MMFRRSPRGARANTATLEPAPAAPAAPAARPAVQVPDRPLELLRRLEFKVLRRLDGFLFGDYSGVFYGPSLDLAEVRAYQPGDEVRRIDWNVTARLGELHVRQYREERELTVWIIADLSSSMNFGTRRVTKRDLALEFAGTTALIVTRHGDKVGAFTLGANGVTFTPPRTGRAQALHVVNALLRAEPGATRLEDALEQAERTLKRRALLFVVSDFLDAARDPAWARPLGRLAQRHDVIAVRVVDPAEQALPNVGGLRLRDPESNREAWLDTSDARVRAAHARLVAAREAAIRRVARAAQVDLLELTTANDIVEPLLRFTAKRRGRRA